MVSDAVLIQDGGKKPYIIGEKHPMSTWLRNLGEL